MMILGGITVIGSIILLFMPNFKWIGILGLVSMILGLIEGFLGYFIAPEDVVTLEDGMLTVHFGSLALRKITIAPSDVISVFAEKLPKNQKDVGIGIVSMRITTSKGEKKISIPDVIDKDQAISDIMLAISSPEEAKDNG